MRVRSKERHHERHQSTERSIVRLLVVEDDRSLAEALRRGLSQEGHIVDVVHDGREGLHLAESGVHDACILDVMLPGMDGITVTQTLRQYGSHLPILLLTARDALPDRIRGSKQEDGEV